MENVDLNIHNYQLDDLLNLFQVPKNFNASHLKNAKKIVLKTHPDKSKLDKKYFLFFSKAYKYLFKIYELRQSGCAKNTEYHEEDYWEKEKTIILDQHNGEMSAAEYNTWFNKKFEEMKGMTENEDRDKGYGEWLKETDENFQEAKNPQQMNELINEKKKNLRQVILHKGIQNNLAQSSGYGELLNDAPDSYSSGLFSNLQYEDVKTAHGESVIPVTEEDFNSKKKYNNLDEIIRDRHISQNDLKQKYSDHEAILDNVTDQEESVQKAYKLMKQEERMRDVNEKFWNNMKQITHK